MKLYVVTDKYIVPIVRIISNEEFDDVADLKGTIKIVVLQLM